jgi:hypothetical protein
MNHILKLNQVWKPEKLPELAHKIHKEIKLQDSLVNGALYIVMGTLNKALHCLIYNVPKLPGRANLKKKRQLHCRNS